MDFELPIFVRCSVLLPGYVAMQPQHQHGEAMWPLYSFTLLFPPSYQRLTLVMAEWEHLRVVVVTYKGVMRRTWRKEGEVERE